MKPQPGFGVSLLLWVVIGLGYVAYRHWPVWRVSGTASQPVAAATSHFTYLPDLSDQVTTLAAKQPAFTALLARMRVNLADIYLVHRIGNNSLVQTFYVALKNRTQPQLSWLDNHPDAPTDMFVDSEDPDKGLYQGAYECLSYQSYQYLSAKCPSFPPDDSRRDYMLAAYRYGLDDDISMVRLCLGADTEINSNVKYYACLKSHPKGWRVTIEDGKFRVYGDPTEAQDRSAAGTLVFEELRYAVIDMSVSWRLAFSPYFFRFLECSFAPSCQTSMLFGFDRTHGFNPLREIDLGIPTNAIEPDTLSMQYVTTTPEFENWGGDELERRLAAQNTFNGQAMLDDKPEGAGSGMSVGAAFEVFVRQHPNFLYLHPSWFLQHPLWALRLRSDLDSLRFQVPNRPLTKANIAQLLTTLHIAPAYVKK